MKFPIALITVIILMSESTIGQSKIELLSNRNLLSTLYKAEIVKSTEEIFCYTDAYHIRYYEILTGKLKYIIKYDCNDNLTHSNYSCNVMYSGSVFEYIYSHNNELKEIITYNKYLEIMAHEEYETRVKSFNETEKLTKNLNGYIIQKIILVDSKPFKTLVIDQDGNLSYMPRKRGEKRKRKYK